MTMRGTLITVLLLTFVGLQLRLWSGANSLAHVNGLQVKVKKSENANTVKEERNKVLRTEIRDLKNGFDMIEEKARSELGLIKEGETFYLLLDQEKP